MIKKSDLTNAARLLTCTCIVVATWFCMIGSALAASNDQPCASTQETRQLDYWLGNWTMGSGADKSTSTVTLSLDKCMFVEHWENGKGHVTEKMFGYSPEDKNWYGMFADNQGRVHVFAGKVAAGVAEFQGPSVGRDGETVLNRIKVVRKTPDKVEQLWEQSTDNGANWKTVFQGEYSRRKS